LSEIFNNISDFLRQEATTAKSTSEAVWFFRLQYLN